MLNMRSLTVPVLVVHVVAGQLAFTILLSVVILRRLANIHNTKRYAEMSNDIKP